MKKWGLIALVLLLILGAAGAAGTYIQKQSLTVPAIDEVVSVDFSENYLLKPGDPVPLPLITAQPEDRAVIEKVLGWIRSAKVAGKGREPLPSMGYHLLVLHLKNDREVSLIQVRRDSAIMMFDTGEGNPVHLDSPNLATWFWDGWKEDVKMGAATSATSAVQLNLQAAFDSVAAGQSVAFTVAFKNGESTEVTLSAPCGHPFNLKVNAKGQETDDWLRQTYGGIPSCPAGQIRVPPGETHSTTLSLRFSTLGAFSVYATNLGAVSATGGNIRSNQVMIHVR